MITKLTIHKSRGKSFLFTENFLYSKISRGIPLWVPVCLLAHWHAGKGMPLLSRTFPLKDVDPNSTDH
jgi:hypothetical protein